MKLLLKSMKSSEKSTPNKETEQVILKDQGRAIARGIAEENARKERNMAIAEKRKQTMLERAAERALRH